MLLEFRVSNFRSIGPEVVLSMLPDPDVSAHSANIITRGKYHALNAVAIYGANAK
jgi:AAA15 family ATPase/GTPase